MDTSVFQHFDGVPTGTDTLIMTSGNPPRRPLRGSVTLKEGSFLSETSAPHGYSPFLSLYLLVYGKLCFAKKDIF